MRKHFSQRLLDAKPTSRKPPPLPQTRISWFFAWGGGPAVCRRERWLFATADEGKNPAFPLRDSVEACARCKALQEPPYFVTCYLFLSSSTCSLVSDFFSSGSFPGGSWSPLFSTTLRIPCLCEGLLRRSYSTDLGPIVSARLAGVLQWNSFLKLCVEVAIEMAWNFDVPLCSGHEGFKLARIFHDRFHAIFTRRFAAANAHFHGAFHSADVLSLRPRCGLRNSW